MRLALYRLLAPPPVEEEVRGSPPRPDQRDPLRAPDGLLDGDGGADTCRTMCSVMGLSGMTNPSGGGYVVARGGGATLISAPLISQFPHGNWEIIIIIIIIIHYIYIALFLELKVASHTKQSFNKNSKV